MHWTGAAFLIVVLPLSALAQTKDSRCMTEAGMRRLVEYNKGVPVFTAGERKFPEENTTFWQMKAATCVNCEGGQPWVLIKQVAKDKFCILAMGDQWKQEPAKP